MSEYNHKEIEAKWQKQWTETSLYSANDTSQKPKHYILDMFPYPSGSGLHVGHPKGYIATDIYSRMKRMQGFNVLHPMGWDAFGLPAEQYAIKNKLHPSVSVKKNVDYYKEQLSIIGFDYDWSREINTTDPEYYKWTQWAFLKMYEKGLAYESHEPINWCPSCQTGLANEDLEDGKCERCGSVVEKKPMRQWVLKITDYADRMLDDLDLLPKWPTSVKESQKNWIGKSEGMLFSAPVKGLDMHLETFSAHFEACYADTFVAIAPDHPLLEQLLEGTDDAEKVKNFAKELALKQQDTHFDSNKNSEGMFTGRYIVDPLGNGDLPIWIAGFALSHYGTGIIKCSCHDQRDFAFAKKHNIHMSPVLFPTDPEEREKVRELEICYDNMGEGILTKPEIIKGKTGKEARSEIIRFLEENNFAKKKTMYRIKDWVFSRQRYWGEPIPLVHCEKCGVVPVPYEELPVKLPEVEHYEPTGTGESPLATIDEWVNVSCPKCGGKGRRETNTMPQWAGSNWYYLRYMDPKNEEGLVSPEKEKYWAPVDLYVGGMEHATRHLIYARFWHKFLFDIGVVSTKEPFEELHNPGLILAEDGRKMSKRWGNVVNPDDMVHRFGADSFRLYEMFMGPFENAIAWNTDGVVGTRRFIEKVWRIKNKASDQESSDDIKRKLHSAIKKVSEDIQSFSFNTAVAEMMILANSMDKEASIAKADYLLFLQILSPFAPHVTEELWQEFGKNESIHISVWPVAHDDFLKKDTVTLGIQINGKVRSSVSININASEAEVQQQVLADPIIVKWLKDKEIKKFIYVPGKIISIVI